MTITYHGELVQGSDEWLQARCGLLTASEVRLIVGVEGGGTVTKYRATGELPEKLTPKRKEALAAIGGRTGTMRELVFIAGVSDGVLRDLVADGALEAFVSEVPRTYRAVTDDKQRAHVSELAAQRITGFVEPRYIGDDMLRGQVDEDEARNLYAKHHAPVDQIGFITNDEWGFTLGYSPDGMVGDDGLIECKSRRQRFQVETIASGKVPEEYIMQLQTGLLVTGRQWIDFVSYSGGLPMCVIRVWPDDKIQSAILEAAAQFEQQVADMIGKFQQAAAGLIPTERRVIQEMYL